MKVLDLRCGQGHSFEGWFASDDDLAAQQARGLLECPMCGDTAVDRLPSAPRLNLSGARAPAPAETPTPSGLPSETQARWLQMMRQLMAQTEDVGDRFAEEARRIHHGEAASRSIRGQATPDERAALLDEGIDVMPLPVLPLLKEPLQ